MLPNFFVFYSSSFHPVHATFLYNLTRNSNYQRDNWTPSPGAVTHAESRLLAQRLFLPALHSPEVYFYSSVILVWGLKADFFLLQREQGWSRQHRTKPEVKPEVIQVNVKEDFTQYQKIQSNCKQSLCFWSSLYRILPPPVHFRVAGGGMKGQWAPGKPCKPSLQVRFIDLVSCLLSVRTFKAIFLHEPQYPHETRSRWDVWNLNCILKSYTRASQYLLPDQDSHAINAIRTSTDLGSQIFTWCNLLQLESNYPYLQKWPW